MIGRRMRWAVAVLLLAGMTAPAGWSEERSAMPPPHDRVDEVMGQYNLHPAFAKLGRGTANALCGWMELPLSLQQRYTERDTAGSLFTGVAYGVFKGAVRTGVGLYEMVTFFLPYPEEFAPILPTLPYFQKTSARRPGPS